jgi:hypothetical protein
MRRRATTADALGRADLKLARARSQRRVAGKQGRAGQLAAAGDDQQPATILLVRILTGRAQREVPQQSASSHSPRSSRADDLVGFGGDRRAAPASGGTAKL